MFALVKPQINKFFESLLSPIAHKLNANYISFLTPVVAFVTIYLLYLEEYAWAGISLFLGLLDSIDGTVARLNNKTTKYGGFLDASLDRVHEAIVLIGMGVILSDQTTWILVSSSLATSLIISYIKAKAEASLGVKSVGANELSVGILERPERLIIIGVSIGFYQFFREEIIGLNLMEIGLSIICSLGFITVVMRMKKAYDLLQKADNPSS